MKFTAMIKREAQAHQKINEAGAAIAQQLGVAGLDLQSVKAPIKEGRVKNLYQWEALACFMASIAGAISQHNGAPGVMTEELLEEIEQIDGIGAATVKKIRQHYEG